MLRWWYGTQVPRERIYPSLLRHNTVHLSLHHVRGRGSCEGEECYHNVPLGHNEKLLRTGAVPQSLIPTSLLLQNSWGCTEEWSHPVAPCLLLFCIGLCSLYLDKPHIFGYRELGTPFPWDPKHWVPLNPRRNLEPLVLIKTILPVATVLSSPSTKVFPCLSLQLGYVPSSSLSFPTFTMVRRTASRQVLHNSEGHL